MAESLATHRSSPSTIDELPQRRTSYRHRRNPPQRSLHLIDQRHHQLSDQELIAEHHQDDQFLAEGNHDSHSWFQEKLAEVNDLETSSHLIAANEQKPVSKPIPAKGGRTNLRSSKSQFNKNNNNHLKEEDLERKLEEEKWEQARGSDKFDIKREDSDINNYIEGELMINDEDSSLDSKHTFEEHPNKDLGEHPKSSSELQRKRGNNGCDRKRENNRSSTLIKSDKMNTEIINHRQDKREKKAKVKLKSSPESVNGADHHIPSPLPHEICAKTSIEEDISEIIPINMHSDELESVFCNGQENDDKKRKKDDRKDDKNQKKKLKQMEEENLSK